MSKTSKLNEVLAIEKGIKTRVNAEVTQAHRASQREDLMNGFHKTYQPKEEGDETYPPESKKVQFNYRGVFATVTKHMSELFNVTAQKDFANCLAKADVIVDDAVLIKDVPATYLLFLEKRMDDLRTLVDKMAELDSAETWHYDSNSLLHKTQPTQTHRTKKVQKPIVLYQATDKHPAQTQLITEDMTVGYWNTVKESGAIPRPEKQAILARIEKVANAVKSARERANSIETERRNFAGDIFGYIFDEK